MKYELFYTIILEMAICLDPNFEFIRLSIGVVVVPTLNQDSIFDFHTVFLRIALIGVRTPHLMMSKSREYVLYPSYTLDLTLCYIQHNCQFTRKLMWRKPECWTKKSVLGMLRQNKKFLSYKKFCRQEFSLPINLL